MLIPRVGCIAGVPRQIPWTLSACSQLTVERLASNPRLLTWNPGLLCRHDPYRGREHPPDTHKDRDANWSLWAIFRCRS